MTQKNIIIFVNAYAKTIQLNQLEHHILRVAELNHVAVFIKQGKEIR